jgi:hypothetical protein
VIAQAARDPRPGSGAERGALKHLASRTFHRNPPGGRDGTLPRHAARSRPGYSPAIVPLAAEAESYPQASIRAVTEGYACGKVFRARPGVGSAQRVQAVAEAAADPTNGCGRESLRGAVMSVVLIGPLSRCTNCGRIPPEGQRWPHVAGGDWFCSLDCLYGLHPELEEGCQ